MEAFEYEVMAAVEGDHWWYSGMRALSAAWLDPLYAQGGLQILDAGCGTGGNGAFLARYGTVTGLDRSDLAVQFGQRRLPGSLVRGSVTDLPYPDECFDLVTSFDVLYHRDVINQDGALRETRRVLRRGGRLLIRLPAYKWLYSHHDRSVHGRQRYTASEARALLETAGLVIERVSYINSVLLPIPVLQRLAERVRSSHEAAQSDLERPDAFVNRVLKTTLLLEASWLRRGGRFPWGLSVLLLARND